MEIIESWKALGSHRVELLDREEVEGQPGTVLLALFSYQAEKRSSDHHPWIHPYYFASHRAYQAHQEWLKQAADNGLEVLPGEDIRLKPLFHRMADYTYGHNTLCYAPEIGSRYHVRILRLKATFPVTCHLQEPKANHCGSCTRCIDTCPTGAITLNGFTPEKCIRFWQMSGQPIPAWIREKMGNRLVGCDDCQHVCPHNPSAASPSPPFLPLEEYLTHPDETAEKLRLHIGKNLTLPNRVLGQACLIAGNSGKDAYLPSLMEKEKHPSPVVADHAAWAVRRLTEQKDE